MGKFGMPEAYCGPAPDPQTLASAWNADFFAFALCAGLLFAHRRYGDRSMQVPLAIGVLLVAVLFISPLCALTVSLFSARVGHHVLLVAVAAPLIALAFPERDSRWKRVPLTVLTVAHAAILWFWHAPLAYEAGIAAALPYWTMQLTLLASAVLLWRRVFNEATMTGAALLALLATVIQMGMLGALLTFARTPLYAAHLDTTLAFGLTPLADQQLAGLIMWVPAALPYLAAGLFLLAARFDRVARNPR